MNRITAKHVLLAATAIGGLALAPAPAAAQSAGQIQSIEDQIRALQAELGKVKASLAARDHALKAAQAQAQAAQAAARAQAAQQAAQEDANAAAAAVAAKPPEPKLPPGTFRVAGVTVRLGGFAAVEGVYRSANQAGSIATNLNTGIPLQNSPNDHTPEYRETAQQSRFSLLAEDDPDRANKLSSYLETDFLSAGSSSNANQSNSYTLRLRQFWGEWDNSILGLHVEGGQGWSLATLYRSGLLPLHENVPLTIDANYVAGFNWTRQPEIRVVKDFADNKLSAGFSVESPQTLFSGSAGPNCLTGAATTTAVGGGTQESTQCGGSNVNTVQAYSDNFAPDLIAKLAADPGWGHYEVYGLLRFLNGRVSDPGSGKNYNATGEGVGGGMILPLIRDKLEFQVSGLFGRGVGRYGAAQMPDATFSPTGKIEPLTGYSVMGGFVAHPTPAVDIYAYGGAEGVQSKYYTAGNVNAGYGNPDISLAGCETELGSCSANTSSVVEGTIGAWWRPYHFSSGGTVQLGVQYEYLKRNTFQGVGATKGSTLSPSGTENGVLVSLRFLPFQ